MPTNFEIATQIVEAAPQTEFVLPAYTGSTTDLAYLKQWVLQQVTTIYGVDAAAFDTATMVSTSVLRDFVHRAIYQTSDPNFHTDVMASPEYLGWNDVANSFRYPMMGICGQLSWQLYEVFRAFGFQTIRYDTINAALGTYTDSHVTTEVYVSDLDKYVIQDATFNFVTRNAQGDFLSYAETRYANHTSTVTYDVFMNYRNYYIGVAQTIMNPGLVQHFTDHYWNVPHTAFDQGGWPSAGITSLYLNASQAHNPAFSQGGTYASAAAALAAVQNLSQQGANWQGIAAGIRQTGQYVSGFAIANADGSHASDWITLRLDSGAYVSINIATLQVLNGSYDQLGAEATGGVVNNPGVDLSAFFNPAYWLSVTGVVTSPGAIHVVPTDQIGTSANDTLTGGVGVDRLIGREGDDILSDGGGGQDYMAGGTGNDTYYVTSGNVTIIENAGEGADTINATFNFTLSDNIENLVLQGNAIQGRGNNGESWVYGNAQNNILIATGVGTGHLYGGAGNDTYYVDSIGDSATETAGNGIDTVYSTIDFELTANVEVLNLTGTAIRGAGSVGEFWIYGNSQNNILVATGSGSGHLYGGTGDDTYYIDTAGDGLAESAGEGIDTVYSAINYTLPENVEILYLTGTAIRGNGNSGQFSIYGNNSNNILSANGSGSGHLAGGLGNDSYYIDGVGDTVVELAGQGIDTVFSSIDYVMADNVEVLNMTGSAIRGTGNAGSFWIYGNNQNNILTATGTGQLYGGRGDDTYYIDTAGDGVVENAGEGIDVVFSAMSYVLGANVEVLNLTGTAIRGTGNAGEFWIYGNAQNNVLVATGVGSGHLYGGLGNDVYYIDTAGDGLAELAGQGIDTVYAAMDFTMPDNVEVLNLTGTAIRGTGNAGEVWIYGNAQNNILAANNGGVGHLFGGLGNDSYFVDDALDGLAENAGEGIDAVYASIDFTLPSNVEILNMTGTAIRGTGNAGEFWIYGNAQNNILVATGVGIGHLYGGLGNDSYYIDSAGDGLAEYAGEGIDTVYASMDYTLPDNVEILNLKGNAIRGSGNSGDFWIYGNDLNNILDARGAGSGRLFGGKGNDAYYINTSGDTVTELAGEGTDTVYAYIDYRLAENVEFLNLKGSAITGIGNSGTYWINGSGLNNILDARVTGTGTLTGGAGSDTFIVGGIGHGRATITDFAVGVDKIGLDKALFGITGTTLAASNVAFVTGTTATSAAATFVYNRTTGALLWDADGTGSGAAVHIATLSAAPNLALTDFVLL